MRLDAAEIDAIARAFVDARRAARPLADFPVRLPIALADSYAVQERALALTGETVAGWKVAMIPPALRDPLADQRLAGPVDAVTVHRLPAGGSVEAEVFDGGFAALEAEFVAVFAADLRPGPDGFTDALVRAAMGSLHAGIEIASSPLATLNALGPLAVVCDHGNNAGIVVGPEIAGWREVPDAGLASRMIIDGEVVGEGSAASVPGGPIGAITWLAGQLASRGRTLRAGDLVSTGMTTGVHAVRPGSTGRIEFTGAAACDVRVVGATARSRVAD